MSVHDHHRSTGDTMMDEPPISAVRRQQAHDQASFWREASWSLARAEPCVAPPIRVFSPDEARLMEAVSAHVMPQDDKNEAPRIPIVPLLDERLYRSRVEGHAREPGETEGHGPVEMPPPAEAYSLGLRGIDALAELLHDRAFVDLDASAQAQVLEALRGGDPPGHIAEWARMPPYRFWTMLVRDLLEVYYESPIARGDLAPPGAQDSAPEPWEIEQAHRAWEAPLSSPQAREAREAQAELSSWTRTRSG